MTHRERPKLKRMQIWRHKTLNRRVQLLAKVKNSAWTCEVLDKATSSKVKSHKIKDRDLYAYYELES